MITTEQVLWRHNKTSCAQKPCLTALYPSDTYHADYPVNLVEWDARDHVWMIHRPSTLTKQSRLTTNDPMGSAVPR